MALSWHDLVLTQSCLCGMYVHMMLCVFVCIRIVRSVYVCSCCALYTPFSLSVIGESATLANSPINGHGGSNATRCHDNMYLASSLLIHVLHTTLRYLPTSCSLATRLLISTLISHDNSQQVMSLICRFP